MFVLDATTIMFRQESAQEKEKYVVHVVDQRAPCIQPPICLDRIVLKSSAYLSIPTDVVLKHRLESLLKDRCSAKTLNYFSKRPEYDAYYERIKIKGTWVYKVPLLFWYLEGITTHNLVDLRKVPDTMPDHIQVKTNFSLRDHQIQVHPLAMTHLQLSPVHATTIVEQCGAGKTIQASYAIGCLRHRTFVGVPIIDLAKQFKEELKVVMDIPDHEIVLIHSDHKGPIPRNKWIYICVFNSAMSTAHYSTKYDDIISSCDVLVVDECHKFPAKCVKSMLKHFHGKYRIGLTATPQRQDGLSHMIFKMLGPQCVYVEREKPPLGMWKMSQLTYYNPKHKGDIMVRKPFKKTFERDAIAMMQRVCEDQVRTKSIAKFMVENLNDNVLVLGDWKNILRDLVTEIEKLRPNTTYLYVGGGSKSKKAKLEKEQAFKNKPYIIATTGKAGCGLNLPRLNTVVFVTSRIPGVLLEQGSGRALRRKCQKNMYYVTDLATPYYVQKAQKCTSWFKKSGYQIMQDIAIGPTEAPGSIKRYLQSSTTQEHTYVPKKRRKK